MQCGGFKAARLIAAYMIPDLHTTTFISLLKGGKKHIGN